MWRTRLFTILGCDLGSSKSTTLPEKTHAFMAFIQVCGISDDYSGPFERAVKKRLKLSSLLLWEKPAVEFKGIGC